MPRHMGTLAPILCSCLMLEWRWAICVSLVFSLERLFLAGCVVQWLACLLSMCERKLEIQAPWDMVVILMLRT